MNSSFRCNQCEFWGPIPKLDGTVPTDGHCHISDPKIVDVYDCRGRWPVTYLDDWCGPGLIRFQRKLVEEEAALSSLIKEEE